MSECVNCGSIQCGCTVKDMLAAVGRKIEKLSSRANCDLLKERVAELEAQLTSTQDKYQECADELTKEVQASLNLRSDWLEACEHKRVLTEALEQMVQEDNGGKYSWQELARGALRKVRGDGY